MRTYANRFDGVNAANSLAALLPILVAATADDDREVAHEIADAVLIRALEVLAEHAQVEGYPSTAQWIDVVVARWRDVPKWYA